MHGTGVANKRNKFDYHRLVEAECEDSDAALVFGANRNDQWIGCSFVYLRKEGLEGGFEKNR